MAGHTRGWAIWDALDPTRGPQLAAFRLREAGPRDGFEFSSAALCLASAPARVGVVWVERPLAEKQVPHGPMPWAAAGTAWGPGQRQGGLSAARLAGRGAHKRTYGGAVGSAISFVRTAGGGKRWLVRGRRGQGRGRAQMFKPSIIARSTPPTAADRLAARHPPRAASTPPVAAPEAMEFQGSSLLRAQTSMQSNVENRPPQTAKLPAGATPDRFSPVPPRPWCRILCYAWHLL